MNKKQRKRAERRKRRKLHERETDTAKNREDITVHQSLEPGQVNNVANSAITKRILPARPHALTITLSIIAILLACITLYWNVVQPDIRYIPILDSETMTVLESKVDSAGNLVHSVRLRPTFINYSIKPGFIDKAEFVPQSITTLPEIRITSINKTFIFWHQTKQIEITFLMTIPTDAANNLNTTRELAVDQVLAVFDNTGRKVDHLQNGLFGRIRFNFKDIAKIQVGGIR